MNNRSRLLARLTIAFSLFLVSMASMAQETTSGARVSLFGPDGNPVSGQTVTITDTRTGAVRTNTTNQSGVVSFRGLPVGGPYTVNVSSPNFANQTVTDISLRLGDLYNVVLQLGAADLEEVVVTGQMIGGGQVALGPSSVFNAETIASMPTVDRDLRDVIRADPRIYIDPSVGGGAVQCSGANPRFNSLTVDGVRMNDLFGLNQNGYPTERQPFAYDSIEQISVELAPFDVVYGQFTACNVNAVTKSGSNEWFGSGFYEYTSDSLKGDSLEGDDIDTGSYSENRYGASLGGAIIQDKLFFFVAYEKQEAANLFDRTAFGAPTVGRVVRGVSQTQLDQIYAIAQDVYGYTPESPISSLDNEDEKYTIKLDWDISENHRASYAYNYNDGFNWTESDNGDDQFEFADHYYERGAELKTHTAALFSSWSDKFSTEVRYSNLKVDNRQLSRAAASGIGEIQVRTFNVDENGLVNRATVFLGQDDSRQSNKLDYESDNYKLAGLYELGDHLLTFGYELDDLEIFNLFLQHTRGEYRFDSGCSSTNPNGCIEQFRLGKPNRIDYGNSPSLDPNDAAAEFGYKTNTTYLQDEWLTLGGDLTLTFGVRYDWYSSDDVPLYNQFFFDRNGFANTETFDGESLIQPRVGFNWNATPDVVVRGGIGLYSGGNPNVWLTNSYQNDGLTNIQNRESLIVRAPPPPENCGPNPGFSLFGIPISGDGRPLFNPPQCQVDAVAFAKPNSGVNAVAPGFEIPKQWRASLGTTWYFGDGYQLNADLLLAQSDDSATILNSTMRESGVAPDGRPLYTDTRAFNSDYILTNVTGSDARSTQLALSASKAYDNLDLSAGYAWTDAEDVNPMTSSVAFSNYANVAVSDPNDPGRETSNYEIEHRFTFSASYSAYWWDDNRTNFTFFGSHSSGRPFSFTYDVAGNVFGDNVDGRHLVYVPTGPNDPKVVFGPNFDVDAFFAYAENNGLMRYAGQIAPRNAFNSSWWTTFDLRVEQELPGFKQGHKFAAYVVFKNLCNLLNDNWCVLEETGFPLMREIIATGLSADKSQYLYNEFFAAGPGRVVEASLWEIAVGLTYRF